jgi:hypothetical protein
MALRDQRPVSILIKRGSLVIIDYFAYTAIDYLLISVCLCWWISSKLARIGIKRSMSHWNVRPLGETLRVRWTVTCEVKSVEAMAELIAITVSPISGGGLLLKLVYTWFFMVP